VRGVADHEQPGPRPFERAVRHRREQEGLDGVARVAPQVLGEALPQSHLLDRLESAGEQHFAAELAGEVGVALEQRDLDAPPREQVRERGAGRPRPEHEHAGHLALPRCGRRRG